MARSGVDPVVCFGSSQRSWVTDVMSYVSDHGGMRVVGTVLSQDDALSQHYDVLIVDDVSSVLSPRLVHRLGTEGRLVVGVYDTHRGVEAKERMLGMGVHAAVPSNASAAKMVRAVADAFRMRSIELELAGPGTEVDPESASAPPTAGRAAGAVVVVTGSDGATEVAVGVAHALVDRRVPTALLDLDTVEPSIAQRLGLPLTPNVFTATEQLRLRSHLAGAYAAHEGFAVISGLPNPREWESLAEIEAADLVEEMAEVFEAVVVKVNRCLEDLASLSGGAGRFDVGRRIVSTADAVVAVTSASPLGAARLLSLLGDVRRLGAPAAHVVVNQTPGSHFVQGEIRDELERSARPASLTFLPADARVRKASWQGTIVRSGPFTRRLRRLVDALEATNRERTAITSGLAS